MSKKNVTSCLLDFLNETDQHAHITAYMDLIKQIWDLLGDRSNS